MKKGFTLVELLVVVLIIGILAAVAWPRYQKAVIRARVTRVLPLLKSIQEAQERFYMSNGCYATDKEALDIHWEDMGLEAHSGFSLGANKVNYTGAGPGISRCYEHASREQDNICPEEARGKFVCNGYGSEVYKQVCLSFSQNPIYSWMPHATYW